MIMSGRELAVSSLIPTIGILMNVAGLFLK